MDTLKKGVCGSDPSICGEEAGCHEFENGTYICICTLDLRIMDPITGCNMSEIMESGYNATNLPLINSLNKTIIDQFNKFGTSNNSNRHNDPKFYIILSIFTCITLTLLLISVVYVYFKRRRLLFRTETHNYELVKLKSPSSVKNLIQNPNYYTSTLESFLLLSTTIRQFEINIKCIKINEEIGEGCFGKVFKGEYRAEKTDEPILVAIKMIKNETLDIKDAKEFLFDFDREIKILSNLDHKNIIKFLGVVRLDPTKISFSMIFEYMPLGDLNQLLRNCSPFGSTNYRSSTSTSNSLEKKRTQISAASSSNSETSGNKKNDHTDQTYLTSISANHSDSTKFVNRLLLVKDLLWISSQISAGMLFLQQHNCTHRDLASRNCLLDENLCVKITDFGMSREIYNEDYYKTTGNKRLPVRWMAPESILFGKFTFESDVWSYGVLLYEIYSYGKQPYYGHSNTQAMQLILDGHLLAFNQPHKIPNIILSIMSRCWRLDPKDRIKFSEILSELADYCTPDQKKELLSSVQMSDDSLDAKK